jgi:glycosyltransferase EpsD
VPGVGIETEKFHSDSINNDEKRKELGLKADDRMFLSVGELSERKNHEIVIRALSKLEDKNYKFFIVGMGKLNDYLAETIKNLNLSEHVFLLGYRTDISELCQAADLFIFPSYQEGLPVALMEAMASGLPCIASNIRGNVELIEDGKGGYLCSPGNANEFAEKINALSNCEELRSRMGAYNREKIRGFDEEIINQRMKELYRTI